MSEEKPPYARVYPPREHFCECGEPIGTQTTGPDGKPLLIRHGDKVLYIDYVCRCGRVIHWGARKRV